VAERKRVHQQVHDGLRHEVQVRARSVLEEQVEKRAHSEGQVGMRGSLERCRRDSDDLAREAICAQHSARLLVGEQTRQV